MRIFLTGASGFIGHHLMNKLIGQGCTVDTDMRLFETTAYTHLVHLAARTHINFAFDPQMYESNVVFAKKIMSTTAKLIYASSCSAAHLTNPYAYTKRFAEYLGERHGRAIGMRFFNVYGPENNKGVVKWLTDQRDGDKIIIRGPELIRDYIYIDDVVDVIIETLLEDDFNQHQIVEVGTGKGTRTVDLVNKFSEISGKKFIVDFGSWGGGNEPQSMVSKSRRGHITLEEGLEKTINYAAKRIANA
jgi:nucleoside-diphosphate-sugar epimerase